MGCANEGPGEMICLMRSAPAHTPSQEPPGLRIVLVRLAPRRRLPDEGIHWGQFTIRLVWGHSRAKLRTPGSDLPQQSSTGAMGFGLAEEGRLPPGRIRYSLIKSMSREATTSPPGEESL